MRTKQEAIGEVIQAVRDFHQIGVQSLRERPKRGEYAAGAAGMEAQKYGINPDTLRKARTFADESVGYTTAEVDELCTSIRTCWDNFASKGATIGRTHILRLLSAPKGRGKRASIQKKMFLHGWSTSSLEAEIRRRFGRRKLGGRRAGLGTKIHELIGHLDLQCEAWLRLDFQLVRRQKEGVRPSYGELPERIRSLLVLIMKRMRKLRFEIDAQMRLASTRRG